MESLLLIRTPRSRTTLESRIEQLSSYSRLVNERERETDRQTEIDT